MKTVPAYTVRPLQMHEPLESNTPSLPLLASVVERANLTSDQAVVVGAVVFEGRSIADTVLVLGLPRSTVVDRLNAANQKIREIVRLDPGAKRYSKAFGHIAE